MKIQRIDPYQYPTYFVIQIRNDYLFRHADWTSEPVGKVERDLFRASRAVEATEGYHFVDGRPDYCFAQEHVAKAALKAARAALRVQYALPEWACKAFMAGWKPPRGWKP